MPRRFSRCFTFSLALGATAPATVLAADPAAPAAPVAAADRKAVADFALPTLDGKKLRLSEQKGKVVLVSFWATWCGPCKQELPFLDAFATKYADKGLVVFAINTDAPKSQSDVRRVVNQKGLKLPVLLDAEGAVASKLDPQNAMPFTVYIDRAGRVAHTHEGFQPGDEKDVEQRLLALLAEPAPAAAGTPAP
jgi:thiol-disulfide isomerase/thioredoxin